MRGGRQLFALGPYLFALKLHLQNVHSLGLVVEAVQAGIRGWSLGAVPHHVATMYTWVEDQGWTLKPKAVSYGVVVAEMNPQRHTTPTRGRSDRSELVAPSRRLGVRTCRKGSMCAYTWILRRVPDGCSRMPMHRCLDTVVVCARRVLRRWT